VTEGFPWTLAVFHFDNIMFDEQSPKNVNVLKLMSSHNLMFGLCMLPNRCKIVERKRNNFHKIVHLVALQNFCFRFEHLLFRACVCSKVGSGNGTMG
jgi:hypothetical protein